MTPSIASNEILPTQEEMRNIVDVALSIVDFWLQVRREPKKARPRIKFPRAGFHVPETIARAVTLLTPLSNLEAAGLLDSVDPPLPTVDCTLVALRRHLVEGSEQFWSNPNFGKRLFEQVFETYFSYDWEQFEGATVAVTAAVDDQFLDQLADLLLRLQAVPLDLSTSIINASAPAEESLFSRLEAGRKRGRRRKAVRIPFGPPSARRCIYYQPSRGRKIHGDFVAITEGLKQQGVHFDVSFAEFEQLVRGSKKRTTANTSALEPNNQARKQSGAR